MKTSVQGLALLWWTELLDTLHESMNTLSAGLRLLLEYRLSSKTWVQILILVPDLSKANCDLGCHLSLLIFKFCDYELITVYWLPVLLQQSLM